MSCGKIKLHKGDGFFTGQWRMSLTCVVNPGSENTARPTPAVPTGSGALSRPPSPVSVSDSAEPPPGPQPPHLPPLCFPAQRSSPFLASSPFAFDLFPLPSCSYSFLGWALLSIPTGFPVSLAPS